MRGILGLCVAALFGCAASTVAAGGANSGTAQVGGAAGDESAITTGGAPIAAASTVPVAMNKLWVALPEVYDSLGIPLSVIDSASAMLGNRGLQIRHQLGGVRLSTYIECASAQGASSADSYDVNLSVTTQLRAVDSTHTQVTTTLDAVARNILFGGEYIHCATKGELERRISDLLDDVKWR